MEWQKKSVLTIVMEYGQSKVQMPSPIFHHLVDIRAGPTFQKATPGDLGVVMGGHLNPSFICEQSALLLQRGGVAIV